MVYLCRFVLNSEKLFLETDLPETYRACGKITIAIYTKLLAYAAIIILMFINWEKGNATLHLVHFVCKPHQRENS